MLFLIVFAESRTVFIFKTSVIDDSGRIIRSLDAFRPLTLCNCYCKLLRGFHWYTMRCIHPSQRCISSRQMTDNFFEIETTALAHVAVCSARIRCLFDRLCRCLSQCQSLLDLSSLCLRMLGCLAFSVASYEEFLATAPRIWNSREQNEDTFFWPEEYDKVCLVSGFFFAMAFGPIFRCLQETIVSKSLDHLDFLQPAQCAYADDFAVDSSSFREMISALAPAFRSVDYIVGLNLNHRKCCWV